MSIYVWRLKALESLQWLYLDGELVSGGLPSRFVFFFLVVLRGHGGFQAAAALPQFALVAVQGHLLQGGGGGQRGGSLHFSVDAAPKRSCLVLVVTSVAGGVDVLHFLCCIRSLNVVYGFGRRNGGKLSVVKLL